jgi:hypothetical protein
VRIVTTGVTAALSDENLEAAGLAAPEQPLEWLERRTGFGREARELHGKGDYSRDSLEWQVAEGFRWREVAPRTVGDLLSW